VDGAVTLHEIVHELKRKKLKGVILKIDFEKAYDSIRWDFVEEVLEKKGFDNKLKKWIMSSVRSVH
jgi:mannosylglycoprotein endo-beta-mannosidase